MDLSKFYMDYFSVIVINYFITSNNINNMEIASGIVQLSSDKCLRKHRIHTLYLILTVLATIGEPIIAYTIYLSSWVK